MKSSAKRNQLVGSFYILLLIVCGVWLATTAPRHRKQRASRLHSQNSIQHLTITSPLAVSEASPGLDQ